RICWHGFSRTTEGSTVDNVSSASLAARLVPSVKYTGQKQSAPHGGAGYCIRKPGVRHRVAADKPGFSLPMIERGASLVKQQFSARRCAVLGELVVTRAFGSICNADWCVAECDLFALGYPARGLPVDDSNWRNRSSPAQRN